MRNQRFLLPMLAAVSLIACTVILIVSICARRTTDVAPHTSAAVREKPEASPRGAEELSPSGLSQRKQDEEHERFVQQAQRLAAAQEQLEQRLDALTSELDRLQAAMTPDANGGQPSKQWQERLSAQNGQTYTEIRDMLAALTEEEFPTVRTWYGAKWHELIKPFVEGRFPSSAERDQLVQLLDDIMEDERRRVAALAEQETVAVASRRNTLPAGYCLGPRWDKLAENLRNLAY